jgi:glutaredoxin 3
LNDILIYTKDWCAYCHAAKQLLQELGQDYREVDVTHDSLAYQEMVQLADGRTSVPQIFIDGEGIGGYTELRRLVSENRFPNRPE